MKSAERILEILYDREGGYVSADELARVVGLSRSGVEARLEALGKLGHRMAFSPTGGVRLARPARPAPTLIERNLGTRRVGRSVVCFDEVTSTNDVALAAARQSDADGLVVVAESQQAGRGRHGRRWLSPPGSGILMSVLLLDAPGPQVGNEALTIAAGLATAEGIEAATRLACELKWPNDVLLAGAKIAGVLVEVRPEARVIGIGVNVNAAPEPSAVDGPATHLADHLAGSVERVEVIRAVLVKLDEWIGRISAGLVSGLGRRFVSRCRMINQRATVRSAGRLYTGRVLDVDPLAGLVLQMDDGSTVRLAAEGASIVRSSFS